MERLIEIKNANVKRNDKLILKDANLTIDKGNHLAIIGPNGAGKSTLLKVIAMEIHPLWNENLKLIRFEKERIMKEVLREKIGFISKELFKISTLSYTARDIIAGGLLSSIGLDFHHKITESMWTTINDTIEKYNCTKLVDKKMFQLSTGEVQKVLLARALVHNPQLLLLDEAASGLDFPSRHLYRNTLNEIIQQDKTIVLVTHDLSQILPQIKRVAFMKDGKIIKIGNKEDLLTEENLSELYDREVFLDKRKGLYSAWC